MQTLIHMALALNGTVVAHFMNSADAGAFCLAKDLTHAPYNLKSRESAPAPVVGSIISPDNKNHTMIIGPSGSGKSVLLQAEAMRLGISYEELMRRLEPSEEATPPDHHDLACLHDALVCSALSKASA